MILQSIFPVQAPETIYRVAGASDDWARGTVGIKYVTSTTLSFTLDTAF